MVTISQIQTTTFYYRSECGRKYMATRDSDNCLKKKTEMIKIGNLDVFAAVYNLVVEAVA